MSTDSKIKSPFNTARFRKLLVGMLFLLTLPVGNAALAQCPSQDESELDSCNAKTKAEKYVLNKIAVGATADFPEKDFPNQKDRVLRACFLRQLLVNPRNNLTVHRHGINIERAIVCGRLDLNNDEVRYDVSLDYCVFMNDFDITQSHFRKSLSVANTIFDGDADFNLATIDFILTTKGAEFGSSPSSTISFSNTRVGSDWLTERAKF